MINDMINPMSFDLTKNLHGHVRVELRDRWTGRVVDSQEKENLVTNAVQELIAAQVWTQTGNSGTNGMQTDVCPLWKKALGGVILFDGTLTEAATNTAFPSSVKIVGCAGQTSDATGSIRGSLNAQESVYTSNGFTTTWDFLTSQANGTIASLARTSYRFISNAEMLCQGSFTRFSDTSATPTTGYAYLGYDETNKYLYLGLTQAQTISGITYPTSNIYRVKADFDNVSLLQSSLPPIARWTSIKTLTSSDGSANATDFIYDEYDNNFVYVNDTTLHLVAIDGTHTTKTLTGTSGDLWATENYYWRRPLTNSTIYCIEKSNVSNVRTIEMSTRMRLRALENDVLCATGQYYSGGIYSMPVTYVYPDGTTIAVSSEQYADGGDWRKLGRLGAAGTSILIPSSYLGTIANLDSPVTKTSSQTMKITYTLTEA